MPIMFTPIDADEFAADMAYLRGLADAMFEHVGSRLKYPDARTVEDELYLGGIWPPDWSAESFPCVERTVS